MTFLRLKCFRRRLRLSGSLLERRLQGSGSSTTTSTSSSAGVTTTTAGSAGSEDIGIRFFAASSGTNTTPTTVTDDSSTEVTLPGDAVATASSSTAGSRRDRNPSQHWSFGLL